MCMTRDPVSDSGRTEQIWDLPSNKGHEWTETLQSFFKFSALSEAQAHINNMDLEEHNKQDRTTASLCLLPGFSQE